MQNVSLQKHIGDFLKLLLSIMLHECLCSLAYGISLVNRNASVRFAVATSTLLSISIPIGMLVMLVVGGDSFIILAT